MKKKLTPEQKVEAIREAKKIENRRDRLRAYGTAFVNEIDILEVKKLLGVPPWDSITNWLMGD